MRSIGLFCWSLIERLLAAACLIALLPQFLLIAFLIDQTAGTPIIVSDELRNNKGRFYYRFRFRTTGQGSEIFQSIGRILRKTTLDEYPSFWNVVHGDITLRELRLGKSP